MRLVQSCGLFLASRYAGGRVVLRIFQYVTQARGFLRIFRGEMYG